MTITSENFKTCERCGRKYTSNKLISKYCSKKCRNSKQQVVILSEGLIKEIYGLISNEKLFSDEEIGRKLRSKKMKEKFEGALFVKDEGV
ncbi:hypothetical protein KKF82_07545 [Patescibacteria group bacterium]|nr:hypothetical protein [Patescibacteria group bacterium]